VQEYLLPGTGIYYRTNTILPNRPALVFVHGLSGSSSAWLEFEQYFESRYNLLTFDLRGHGKSRKFPNYEDYEIKKLAGDITELVRAAGITTFTLVSHSFGTIIALEFAAGHPEMVNKIVLLSPIFDIQNVAYIKMGRFALLSLAPCFGALPASSKPGRHIDYLKYRGTGDWNLRRICADLPNTTLRVYFYCLKQIYKFVRNDILAHSNIPVLILHGENDTMSPIRNSVRAAATIRNVKLIRIADANHMLPINKQKEICEAIESFVG
jgi:pimeloyl-ACP methyl ester carboxylesterase